MPTSPLLFAIACGATACTFGATPPTCAAGDLDCFMDQLSFRGGTGTIDPVFIDTDALRAVATTTATSASAPALTRAPASLSYPDGTLIDGADVIDTNLVEASFTDPNGCQPVLGFTLASNGARSKHTGCFPGLHDGKKSGTITTFVGFTATAAAPATFDLELSVISSTDCASIDAPATLVGDPGAVADMPITIPLMISPPPADPGGGGGTCPGGLLISTLECDPLGSSGSASYCLTAAEFMTRAMMPLPSACYAAGTTGCESESGPTAGVLVKPCCPGLTCKVGAGCGDASNAGGGTCL